MKVKREELLAQLEKVKSAARATSALPDLGNFWFDKSHVWAYDGGLCVRVPLVTDAVFSVPAGPLMALLASTPVAEIDFSVKGDGLTIKLGRGTAKLVANVGHEMFWEFPDKLGKDVPNLELTEEVFEALRKMLIIKPPSAKDENTRGYLYGVTLVPTKGGYSLYSTDSNALARVSVKEKNFALSDPFILPRAFVEQVLRLCKPGTKVYLADRVKVGKKSASFLYAQDEDVAIWSNLIETDGVDELVKVVDRVLPDDAPRVSIPMGMGVTLGRAQVLAGDKKVLLSLELGAKSLTCAGVFKLGELAEELPLRDGEKGKAAEIFTDGGLLIRGLPEAVEMSISESSLALYGDNDFLFLLAAHKEQPHRDGKKGSK
jgi:DNA polymerase III sliding clamp (beta) subunit (PCNA family)